MGAEDNGGGCTCRRNDSCSSAHSVPPQLAAPALRISGVLHTSPMLSSPTLVSQANPARYAVSTSEHTTPGHPYLHGQVGSEPGVLVYLRHGDALVRVTHQHACQQITALIADLNAGRDGPLRARAGDSKRATGTTGTICVTHTCSIMMEWSGHCVGVGWGGRGSSGRRLGARRWGEPQLGEWSRVAQGGVRAQNARMPA